jgi:hypothetical protein
VAYVSAVEAIALTLFQEEKCAACSNRINIGAKFSTAIELAIGERGRDLLRPVYGKRSKTVHTGKLHASEETSRAAYFNMFVVNPESQFRVEILHEVKVAAERLLTMALRERLPPKRSR